MRSQRRVGVVAGEICRCDEKLKTLGVGSWRAVSLVHVAATDPLRAGSNANLISRAVVADRGTGGVGAVSLIVTRNRAVRAAAAATGVNRIMPVKVMVGRQLRSNPDTLP